VRRTGLGRGLGALIPPEIREGKSTSAFRDIPLASIRPNPNQPRTNFDEESLSSLAASIQAVGVLQPILVRQLNDSEYELIAGERRWRAARRAGLQTIPALVQQVEEVESLERALIENLHREQLGPLEEAAAYQQLLEDFGITHDELAARIGRSRSAITNALRLFQLPPAVQQLLADGLLTAGHARAILGTPDREAQEAIARRVVDEGLSVRATEELVRQSRQTAPQSETNPPDRAAPPSKPPAILELEELLSTKLDTRVKIQIGANKGKIVIEFSDLSDLERVYNIMVGA